MRGRSTRDQQTVRRGGSLGIRRHRRHTEHSENRHKSHSGCALYPAALFPLSSPRSGSFGATASTSYSRDPCALSPTHIIASCVFFLRLPEERLGKGLRGSRLYVGLAASQHVLALGGDRRRLFCEFPSFWATLQLAQHESGHGGWYLCVESSQHRDRADCLKFRGCTPGRI